MYRNVLIYYKGMNVSVDNVIRGFELGVGFYLSSLAVLFVVGAAVSVCTFAITFMKKKNK